MRLVGIAPEDGRTCILRALAALGVCLACMMDEHRRTAASGGEKS